MGWAHCGEDPRGRQCGYAVPAKCDDPGCPTRIDRGLSYVCGGMHGGDSHGCGGYFCEAHLFIFDPEEEGVSTWWGDRCFSVCAECLEELTAMAAELRQAKLTNLSAATSVSTAAREPTRTQDEAVANLEQEKTDG